MLAADPALMRLPRVDAHVAGPGPATTAGIDDLRPELAAVGIDRIVLVAAPGSTRPTRELLAEAEAEPLVAGVVGWVDLASLDVDRQVAALRAGPGGQLLVGLWHPVREEHDPDWLLDERVGRGLAAVEAARLTVELEVSARELPAAEQACRARSASRFVVDHLATPPIASGDLSAWGGALLSIARLPNVYAKISGLVTEADPQTWSIDDLRHPIELAIDAFGAGRLMLGSDWPRCLSAGSYADAMDACRYLLAELPAHEQGHIQGGTAARVYRLARDRRGRDH